MKRVAPSEVSFTMKEPGYLALIVSFAFLASSSDSKIPMIYLLREPMLITSGLYPMKAGSEASMSLLLAKI